MDHLRPGARPEGGGGWTSYDEFKAAFTNNKFPEPSKTMYWTFLREARDIPIFDKQELAMILAHIIHESNGLTETRENVDMKKYPEGYKDPTCDAPGQLYFGRGYLKVTGCKNYRDLSTDIFQDPISLVKEPDLILFDHKIAMKASFALWNRHVHGLPEIEEGQFGATTRALRGASECSAANQQSARRRFEIYTNVRNAFNLEPGNEKNMESGCYVLNEFIKATGKP